MSKISYEKRTVDYMIGLYCRKNHRTNGLCPDCETLKDYALDRLIKCPFGEDKPACKECKIHCYQADMKANILEVMRFSGPRMIIYFPLDYLKHLIRK